MTRAKANGANVVKQWDSTIDKKVRETHAKLDGQVRELEESFEVDGKKAMYPHDFGIASEDINCRCSVLERARWAIEEDNPLSKNIDGNIVEFKNMKDYNEFKKRYFEFYNENDTILSLDDCEKLIKKHGINFWKEDLSKIDKQLLSDNTKRLDELISKYPKLKDFIKEKNVKFNALNMSSNTLAHCSTDIEIKNIEISLNKKIYKDLNTLIEIEKKSKQNFFSMDYLEKYTNTYTITHEFGHFLESKIIDDYNKEHLAEFLNMKTKALNSKTIAQAKRVREKWDLKITDKIAQEIHEIAIKNNKNFELSKTLSKYGKTDSFEFFAECFTNLQCGKPNELGLALEEFLKKRGF